MRRYAQYLLILIQQLKKTEVAKVLLVAQQPYLFVGIGKRDFVGSR
jgi:hypothetical protein